DSAYIFFVADGVSRRDLRASITVLRAAWLLGRLLVLTSLAALRRQQERGVLLASYCTGSFLLAEAGLLDGGVATTHWAKGKVFASRYPEVELRIADIITEQEGI